jgi:Fe2+ or Zn2+ uptake regulation protein
MACFKCGSIMEYPSSSFEKLGEEIARNSGFDICTIRLEIGGVCKKCRVISLTAGAALGKYSARRLV